MKKVERINDEKVDEILEVDSSLPFKMPVQKLVNTGQAVVEKR